MILHYRQQSNIVTAAAETWQASDLEQVLDYASECQMLYQPKTPVRVEIFLPKPAALELAGRLTAYPGNAQIGAGDLTVCYEDARATYRGFPIAVRGGEVLALVGRDVPKHFTHEVNPVTP